MAAQPASWSTTRRRGRGGSTRDRPPSMPIWTTFSRIGGLTHQYSRGRRADCGPRAMLSRHCSGRSSTPGPPARCGGRGGGRTSLRLESDYPRWVWSGRPTQARKAFAPAGTSVAGEIDAEQTGELLARGRDGVLAQWVRIEVRHTPVVPDEGDRSGWRYRDTP